MLFRMSQHFLVRSPENNATLMITQDYLRSSESGRYFSSCGYISQFYSRLLNLMWIGLCKPIFRPECGIVS